VLSEIHEPVLRPYLDALTLTPPSRGITIQLPGGEIHTFNGHYRFIGTGNRVAPFTPGRGRANPVRTLPDLQHTPPSQAPMPKRKGIRLGRVAPAGITVGVALEVLTQWQIANQLLADKEAWLGALEIIADAAELIATEPQPDAALARLPPAIGIATAQEDEDEEPRPRQKRTVIHGYSRKKP